MSFKNKTAVIFGAASGIGQALAKKAAQCQMNVAIADYNWESLQQTHEMLKQIYPKIISQHVDVCELNQIKSFHQLIKEKFGEVHYLFNNAGISGPVGPIWQIDPKKWQETLNVNLQGIIHCLSLFVPSMQNQADPSHIINTCAISGFVSYRHFSAYQITKHALIALSEGLLHDLNDLGANIKVSVLCPGWVKTHILNAAIKANLTEEQVFSTNEIQSIRKIAKNIKNGDCPYQIADFTFSALKEGKFYLFPQPQFKQAIAERFNAILAEKMPIEFEL